MTISAPRDGWRVFAGEVGVIVLGVLIALGAQQAVETWQVRKDVSAFRETVDREVAYNLFRQDVRYVSLDCDRKRLAEVKQWLEQSRSGQVMPPIYLSASPGIAPYRGAWNSRDAETYRQLPPAVREKYALLYDNDDNFQSFRESEVAAWRELRRFSEPGPVTLEERRNAAAPITSLQRRIGGIKSNIEVARQIAHDLGVTAIRPPDERPDVLEAARKCRSITDPGS